MKIQIKIDENEFKKELVKAMMPEVNKFLAEKTNQIKPELSKIIKDGLFDGPEVDSLLGGDLQAELGLEDPQQRLNAIIDRWSAAIDVNFSPAKYAAGRIFASVQISAIRNDYADVLGMDEARYVTKNNTTIEWLEWILLYGDKKIILDYDIGIDPLGLSRTGLGKIMIKGRGKSWSVPSQFAGFAGDNFVTRTIERLESKIASTIERIYSK